MVGKIALLNYPENLSEAVDQEVVAVMALHEVQHVFPDSFQISILVRLKSGLVALGGVKNDTGGFGTPFRVVCIDAGGLVQRGKKNGGVLNESPDGVPRTLFVSCTTPRFFPHHYN